jgi:hypothetical protein
MIDHRAASPIALALLVALAGCNAPPAGDDAGAAADSVATMDTVAQGYVRAVLGLGLHDPDYVDAYYGPQEVRSGVESAAPKVGAVRGEAKELLAGLLGLPEPERRIDRLRRRYLRRQLESLISRGLMLGGERLSFDEESRALYDAVAPHLGAEHFDEILARLDRRLPGNGELVDRYAAWKEAFVIPPDRLDAVFRAAIDACRERTKAHLELPAEESFKVEYVTGKSWSAYNWYKGGLHSLIQVNTDLPVYIDRAIDLACHEGYPGHHVYNALLEARLVRDRGWTEYTVYPLFSPQSLIAEGSANFGIEMAFPGEERTAFERETLFPLAGLDPARAGEYAEVRRLVEGLSYAGNEAARRYLDGEIDAAAAAAWLERYALMPADRAAQRVRFIDQYRSYVINYNLGQDLVREWVEAQGGTAENPERRWEVFGRLLSTPRTPSGLVGETAAAAKRGGAGEGAGGAEEAAAGGAAR